MGEFEQLNKPLDQTKSTESDATNSLLMLSLERQHTSFDAKQQRQKQTAGCVDKGHLPGCVLAETAKPTDTANLKSNADSNPSKLMLEEPGKVVQRIPASVGMPFEQITYADETQRQVFSSGEIIESRKDGMKIHAKPDHDVTVVKDGKISMARPALVGKDSNYELTDIKSTKVDSDGNVTYEYANGAKEIHSRDPEGRVEVTFADGSGYLQNPDGSKWVVHADRIHEEIIDENNKVLTRIVHHDDATIFTDANGRVTMTQRQDDVRRDFLYDEKGQLTEVIGKLGNWSRYEDASGKPHWKNKDTNQVWDGDFKVDKDGHLYFTPNGLQSPTWKFTRDGRDVPLARPSNGSDAIKAEERRRPIAVDTSVPIPRDIFDRDGKIPTVSGDTSKSHRK